MRGIKPYLLILMLSILIIPADQGPLMFRDYSCRRS